VGASAVRRAAAAIEAAARADDLAAAHEAMASLERHASALRDVLARLLGTEGERAAVRDRTEPTRLRGRV